MNLRKEETRRESGASETVTNKLGRTPSELQPEGFEFDPSTDLDVEVAAGLEAEVYLEEHDIDEQLALGKQLNALDLDDSPPLVPPLQPALAPLNALKHIPERVYTMRATDQLEQEDRNTCVRSPRS